MFFMTDVIVILFVTSVVTNSMTITSVIKKTYTIDLPSVNNKSKNTLAKISKIIIG